MSQVIVALDVATPAEALVISRGIDAEWYKIGLGLIYQPGGIDLVRRLREDGRRVFLDAKLYDIPSTVARATRTICEELRPNMLSVAVGVEAALGAVRGPTVIVHVPTLTSDVAVTAVRSPAGAIVCRPALVPDMRALNPTATLICPGVRVGADDPHDHVGSTTMPDGAQYVVVGRPIIMALDPRDAYIAYTLAARGSADIR